MLANSLIMGLITYTTSIVYNLIIRKSLETVFYLGLRFLFYTTFMTLFLQLSYYLIKDLYLEDKAETNIKVEEKDNDNSQTETEKETDSAERDDQGVEESAIDNEFENDEFSAFNPEDFDSQNNNQ